MKTIGQKIKSLRIALGLSREQLSEIIEVTHKSIYRYETGKSLPDTTTLVKLATYFDVSTDYLLGLSGLKNQRKEEYGKIRQSGKYNEIYKDVYKRQLGSPVKIRRCVSATVVSTKGSAFFAQSLRV